MKRHFLCLTVVITSLTSSPLFANQEALFFSDTVSLDNCAALEQELRAAAEDYYNCVIRHRDQDPNEQEKRKRGTPENPYIPTNPHTWIKLKDVCRAELDRYYNARVAFESAMCPWTQDMNPETHTPGNVNPMNPLGPRPETKPKSPSAPQSVEPNPRPERKKPLPRRPGAQ